tara:strand:+ start:246 stop:482 length:237 start_codon:yes stop_codon:yes gene_type:complete
MKLKQIQGKFVVRIVESRSTAYFVQFVYAPSYQGKKNKVHRMSKSYSPDTHPEVCREMVGLINDLCRSRLEAAIEACK